MAKEYTDKAIRRTMASAELGKNEFWKILKGKWGCYCSKNFTVQSKSGTIVQGLEEVLEVWRSHISELCTLVNSEKYDSVHFEQVNECISQWMSLEEKDDFLSTHFTVDEVSYAISKLNLGKAAGINNLTAEHFEYGGAYVPRV